MPKSKLDITDDIISIYVEKYFGEKLRIIQQRYNVKYHSSIYFYCSIVEERSVFSTSLREKIENRKNEYKSEIGINRETEPNALYTKGANNRNAEGSGNSGLFFIFFIFG